MNLSEKLNAIMPEKEAKMLLAYVHGEKAKEKAKDKKPVTSNDDESIYTMAFKFWGLGLLIDGINVVITGKSMAMVTYHGYKNKVKQIYPSAKFDVQLVRESDTFTVSKESGKVEYAHIFGNVFENSRIIGAYCIIDIDGTQYLEILNMRDFEEMKKASKQSYLWKQWESEFVLKSVVKRACKRHFNDITVEIDKADNEEFGIKKERFDAEKVSKDKEKQRISDHISSAKDISELDMVREFVGDHDLVEELEAKEREILDAK